MDEVPLPNVPYRGCQAFIIYTRYVSVDADTRPYFMLRL